MGFTIFIEYNLIKKYSIIIIIILLKSIKDDDTKIRTIHTCKSYNLDLTLFGGLFRLPSHVWSVGGMTLLGPGSFWGVASRTQR